MFDIIKNIIYSKNYELKEMLYKINIMYIEGNITKEQKEELENLSRENAKAENSYAPLQKQIDALAERISILENKNRQENIEDEEIIEEYPEYVQPIGSHDAYNLGAKITYNGKKYECLIDNCVWTPLDYPQGWRVVDA